MGARWRGHPHPELYEMINNGPGAGASDEQTAYWQNLTTELSQVDADLNKALTELKATWEGAAADGANASMTPLQEWSGDATSGSSVMRASTENQAEYIAKARAEMPPPVPVTTPEPSAWQMATAGASMVFGNPGPAAAVAIQAADHERQEAAQNAAEQKAVDTMVSYESISTWNRNTLGTFVAPPDVVIDTPPPRGDGTANPNGPGGWNNSFAYNGSTTTTSGSIHTPPSPPGGTGGNNGPTPPGAGPNNPGGNPLPPGPPPGGVGVGTGGNGNGNGSTDPSNVVPAPPAPPPPPPNPPLPPGPPPGPPTTGPGWGPVPGLNPLSTNLPFGGGDSTRPGAPGGPGGRGAGGPGMPPGFGGMDADGRSSAQLGRGGVAGLGTAGVEGVVNRGGSGGVIGGGRGGAGMHGAPMGAGGRMAGEEDDEHSAPDYLLETTDVFGDDRMVSPAVIGENPNEVEK